VVVKIMSDEGSASLGIPGLPGESLIIENFSGERRDEKYFGHVTSPDCYPVQDNFFSLNVLKDDTKCFIDEKKW
jgi:hypothetical protein